MSENSMFFYNVMLLYAADCFLVYFLSN